MSRIDQALARARNLKPEDLVPAMEPVTSDPSMPFAVEATEPDTPEIHEISEAAAVVEQVPEFVPPLDPEFVPPVDDETAEPSARVIDPEGRVEDLPIAEKLMLNGGNPGDPTPVEQYRRLAARLCMAQAEHGIRIVMVTSALPSEGKTLTATNVALTLSESYKRDVLLIDADLRRPCVHQVFHVPNASGLNDGLRSEADRKVPLLRFTERLSLLTAGRPDSDPMSILSGERMKRVLGEARERFEWVIVDTPPVALLTDAHLLSSLVDAVLLVVRAGQTPLPAINTAIEAVGRDRIFGIVLNHAEPANLPTPYNYYDSYRAGV